MKIAINPVPSFPSTATQLEIVSLSVNLGVGATASWRLLDANNAPASQITGTSLTDAQYAAWTGDDTFVAACIASNNGLTPA